MEIDMRIASPGHAALAATMIAIGIMGFIAGDFAPIWQPVSKTMPGRDVLVYLTALIALIAGIGLFWQRAAASAARLLLGVLVLWLLVFKAPSIWRAPTNSISYENCGETSVIVAGVWMLYAWFANDWDKLRLGFVCGKSGVRIARTLYGLALIAFGIAHVQYVKETAALVPSWLPAHLFWAYFTGCAYIVAGIGVASGVLARAAAALVAVQMGMFTLLIWAPTIVAGPSAEQWSEFVVSWTLAVSGWVVAESYRHNATLIAR
jgi:uncharacterized membrane protein